MVSNGNSFSGNFSLSNGHSMSEANSFGLGTEVCEPWLIRVTAGNGDGWR